MDTQFVWQDEFNIGVEIIDKEHQRLFNGHARRELNFSKGIR